MTPMDAERIAELKALAEAANQDAPNDAYVAFADTFDPPTVLELLAEVERLKGLVEAGRQRMEEVCLYSADLTAERDEALAVIERVRAAVNIFCHGEQAYAEHAHYCTPILRALDGGESS